jgi:chromosome partitioning protein
MVILIANSKGGCGKTTIATNLACYYEALGRRVSLLDMDPQQSSLQWLKLRQNTTIHGLSWPGFPGTTAAEAGPGGTGDHH